MQIGNDMKVYYNTGTNASPVWVEVCLIGDVSVDLSVSDAELDLRCSGWMLNLPGKFDGGINFKLTNHVGNSVFDTIRGYFFNKTLKQWASATGAIATNGTQYWKAFAYVQDFAWQQGNQDVSSHDVKLKLAYVEESSTLITPSWVIVS